MAGESNLQVKIRKRFELMGILVFKFRSPAQRGVPDLLLICDGKTIYMELKNPNKKGRLSALQEVVIGEMRQHGAVVYVIDSLEGAYEVAVREFNREPK